MQEAGEWVKVVSYTATAESLTLKLKGSEKAVTYGVLVSRSKAEMSMLQNEANKDNYYMFIRSDEYTLNGNEGTCNLYGLDPNTK